MDRLHWWKWEQKYWSIVSTDTHWYQSLPSVSIHRRLCPSMPLTQIICSITEQGLKLRLRHLLKGQSHEISKPGSFIQHLSQATDSSSKYFPGYMHTHTSRVPRQIPGLSDYIPASPSPDSSPPRLIGVVVGRTVLPAWPVSSPSSPILRRPTTYLSTLCAEFVYTICLLLLSASDDEQTVS